MSKKVAAAPAIHNIVALLARSEPEAIAPWKSFKELKAAAFKEAKAKWDAEVAKAATPDDIPKEPVETDFGIEDARVRRHLDKLGLNAAITAYVNTIKDKYKKLGIKKPEFTPDEIARRDAVLSERIRIGNPVPTFLRGFCEEIINDLTHIAIEAALRADRKIVLDSHIFENDCLFLAASQFKNLFMQLPTFMDAREKYTIRGRSALVAEITDKYLSEFSRYISENGKAKFAGTRENIRAFINKSHKEEDDAPQSDAPSTSTAPAATGAEASTTAVAAPVPVVAAASAEAVAEEGPAAGAQNKKDARFIFYIRRMTRIIRLSDPRFQELRFSRNIIPFLDNILTEFVQLISMRAIIHIMETGAETVSKSIIHAIILGMMATPASLMERSIVKLAMDRVEKNVTEKVVGADGVAHNVKHTEESDELVATLAEPAFIKFVDDLYPLGMRGSHHDAEEESAAAASAVPALAAIAAIAATAVPIVPAEKAKAPAVAPAVAPVVAPAPIASVAAATAPAVAPAVAPAPKRQPREKKDKS